MAPSFDVLWNQQSFHFGYEYHFMSEWAHSSLIILRSATQLISSSRKIKSTFAQVFLVINTRSLLRRMRMSEDVRGCTRGSSRSLLIFQVEFFPLPGLLSRLVSTRTAVQCQISALFLAKVSRSPSIDEHQATWTLCCHFEINPLELLVNFCVHFAAINWALFILLELVREKNPQ